MRKESNGFIRSDATKLRRAMAQVQDKRTYVRMQAVLLYCEGKHIKEITALLLKSRQVVYNWVKLFLYTHDPFSLCETSRSGRPLAASAITQKRIVTALKKEPHSAGYQVNAWTVETLADYLNRSYQTSITVPTLRRRMKQIGLRYKRPRYVYQEKAPHVAQKKGSLSES